MDYVIQLQIKLTFWQDYVSPQKYKIIQFLSIEAERTPSHTPIFIVKMAQLILACGLLSILNFPVISAVPFEITLYSEPNFTGQNTKIRLTDTNPDFECVSKAIGGVGSYCSVGRYGTKSDKIFQIVFNFITNCSVGS